MNMFAIVVLLVWMPLVVFLFNTMPPRTAVANLFVSAWLLLPITGIAVPGLPDYTKMSSTLIGVMIWIITFDQARLGSLRFRWFDLPAAILVTEPFMTALLNDLGPYEGVAAVIDHMFTWGLPYIVGRLYLNDVEGAKALARAIVLGALCYIPFLMLELRISPVLGSWIYGIVRWDSLRYGGYRPKVFLAHGLELGMWLTNANLLMYTFWYSGSIKMVRGISIGKLALALLVTTILCKSTGALCLLVLAVFTLWLARWTKRTWPIWLMLAIPPTYCVTRALDLWSGQQAVDVADSAFGGDRAQSLEYRFMMEKTLASRALERPMFGWGRFGRNLIYGKDGKLQTVPDGYWIISLGTQGFIGLTCVIAMFSLPMILAMRRFPISEWSDPYVAPVIGLSMMLALSMIDFLSNAMLNTIYPLAIGGLISQLPYRRNETNSEAKERLTFAFACVSEGRMVEAEREFRHAIELASGWNDVENRKTQAESFDGLGHTLMAIGRFEDSATAFGEALVIRDELTAEFPDADHFRDLAIARDGMSRALAEAGRITQAVEQRQIAMEIWRILSAGHPKDVEYRERLANTLNDLAWLLATAPEPSKDDAARALALAEEAVRVSSDRDSLWNTLGVARYRAGDWAGSIEALERSAVASPGGTGTAFDHYFLAMAWCRLQHLDQAGEWLERGKAWVARHRPDHSTLARFRDEAEELLREEHDA